MAVVADLVAGGAGVVVAAVAAPPLGALARSTGLVDRPGALKVHALPVPYLGGAAVLAGVAAAASSRLAGGRFPLGVVGALALACALGATDDARDLPVALRVVGQALVGVVVAATAGTRMGGPGWVPVVALVVLMCNAVNLIDGLDGLAGGVGLVSAAGFAFLLPGAGRLLAIGLAGALVGFLLHNRPPARIYLGDGGSYLLGTALAALVALAWQQGAAVATSAASLLLVAFPVAEVVFAVVRRRRSRLGVLAGDRSHTYDRLAGRGWPLGAVSLACALSQAVLVGAGLGAAAAGAVVAVLIVGAVAASLLVAAGLGGLLGPGAERAAR